MTLAAEPCTTDLQCIAGPGPATTTTPRFAMSHINGNQSRNADKFVIRMPDGMRDRIATIAEGNRRSMNSEIVGYLERMIDDASAVPTNAPLAQNNDEVRILNAFRALNSDKKAAALVLLGGVV